MSTACGSPCVLAVVRRARRRWVASSPSPPAPTYGARTTADEPQYLLTAISLAEDRDLDITRRAGRASADAPSTRRRLPEQTDAARRRPAGQPPRPAAARRCSRCRWRLGGWAGGASRRSRCWPACSPAAMVWVAVRRFARAARRRGRRRCSRSRSTRAARRLRHPGLSRAARRAGRHGRRSPRSPAAAPRAGRRSLVVAVVAPAVAVGQVRAGGGRARGRSLVVRLWRRGGRGGTSLVARRCARRRGRSSTSSRTRSLYGGWTVYAAGDHFVGGELTVVGHRPELRRPRAPARRPARRPRLRAGRLGARLPARRARRRRAGCAGARRGWLALVAAARRRLAQRHVRRAHHARLVVAGPPGRRRRCPCLVLAVAWCVAQVRAASRSPSVAGRRRRRRLGVAGRRGGDRSARAHRRLLARRANPLSRLVATVATRRPSRHRRRRLRGVRLPRSLAAWRYAGWLVRSGRVAAGWPCGGAARRGGARSGGASAGGDEDAGAGERADADVACRRSRRWWCRRVTPR